MTYSYRLYSGKDFCLLSTGHRDQDAAKTAAGERMTRQPDYFTHAIITENMQPIATLQVTGEYEPCK